MLITSLATTSVHATVVLLAFYNFVGYLESILDELDSANKQKLNIKTIEY